jgi:hypothetical protein
MDVQASLRGRHAAARQGQPHSTVDGLRIEFGKEWVHLRRSNTEPIVRIYAEAATMAKADEPGAAGSWRDEGSCPRGGQVSSAWWEENFAPLP